MNHPISPKEKAAIINSLRAGVVPRLGLHHLQVGRYNEVNAILKDLETVSNGAASVRFIIGKFGAGKSFFTNLCRITAIKKKLYDLRRPESGDI
jgi:hypothetical protein